MRRSCRLAQPWPRFPGPVCSMTLPGISFPESLNPAADSPNTDPADPPEQGNQREWPGAKDSGSRGAVPGPCGRRAIPREPGAHTFLAQNRRLLMQVVHVFGPQGGTTRTPVSWVSWA